MKHYSEADLLETYYMQPGASLPVMMHLADCSDCAARYERLDRKIRGIASSCHTEQPESFWVRQRHAIMERAQQQPRVSRTRRIAAAAMLVAVLAGAAAGYRATSERQQQQQQTAPSIVVTTPSVPADPWDSEQLDEFGSLVAWESWEGEPRS
jgi:anti-sigma factor RsiW